MVNQIYPLAALLSTVNEPSSWFREESTRSATDLEALNLTPFTKGKVKAYRCTLLDRECQYYPHTGSGDCRRCNFALVYLMANPQYVKEIMVPPK